MNFEIFSCMFPLAINNYLKKKNLFEKLVRPGDLFFKQILEIQPLEIKSDLQFDRSTG